MSTNKDNPQWNVRIHIGRCFEYDDVLKYVLFNFSEKVDYKKSQLERSEIKISIQEFINICSDFPFQIDKFDNKTFWCSINLDLFENLDLSQVANRPFYASLFLVLDRAMFLEKKCEKFRSLIKIITLICLVFIVICHLFLLDMKYLYEKTLKYFNIYVYFDDFNPEIIKLESYDETLISYDIKEINVVIKRSILGVEGLDCFKNYCKLIISTNKEIDEPNLSKSKDEMTQ